jgi:hypothetical protein
MSDDEEFRALGAKVSDRRAHEFKAENHSDRAVV